ncbi:unnamed protein product [Adineta steineri]|uniref:Uncharacterized protein n=1 Tax=Adineta steineri TaxID=433720 RepID=A0A815I0F1_9BILA|nr:unnamed protein product [Adineta steineri]CAF1600103.1 unnamed protein product [Adineta steineri]
MMNNDEQDLSDDSSVEITENPQTNDQKPISNKNIHSTQAKNRHSLPNLNIKHPYYSINDDKDPFIDETKVIIDEHVKISHVPRTSAHNLNTDLLVPKSDADSRRKSTDNTNVSRPNKTVHHTSKEDNINQDIDKKVTAAKSMVKRVSLTNELPRKMSSEDVHVHVKHITVNKKK